MSAQTGMPQKGENPVFAVKSGETIQRGDLLYFSAPMEVAPVTSAARGGPIAGVAAEDFPKSSGAIAFESEADNQGPATYGSVGTRDKIAVIQVGAVWINVKIPAGSSTDVVIVDGDWVVPVLEAGTTGGCALYDTTPAIPTPNDTEILAALDEMQRIAGVAIHDMHRSLVGADEEVDGQAALHSNVLTSGTLTAQANAVFGKIPILLRLR